MNLLCPNAIPKILYPDVFSVSQDTPLSVVLSILPEFPTATKVLLPYVTPLSCLNVKHVSLSQDAPLSPDLKIFPDCATAKNTSASEAESMAEDLSSCG